MPWRAEQTPRSPLARLAVGVEVICCIARPSLVETSFHNTSKAGKFWGGTGAEAWPNGDVCWVAGC